MKNATANSRVLNVTKLNYLRCQLALNLNQESENRIKVRQ